MGVKSGRCEGCEPWFRSLTKTMGGSQGLVAPGRVPGSWPRRFRTGRWSPCTLPRTSPRKSNKDLDRIDPYTAGGSLSRKLTGPRHRIGAVPIREWTRPPAPKSRGPLVFGQHKAFPTVLRRRTDIITLTSGPTRRKSLPAPVPIPRRTRRITMARVFDPLAGFARFLAQAERSPLTINNYRGGSTMGHAMETLQRSRGGRAGPWWTDHRPPNRPSSQLAGEFNHPVACTLAPRQDPPPAMQPPSEQQAALQPRATPSPRGSNARDHVRPVPIRSGRREVPRRTCKAEHGFR